MDRRVLQRALALAIGVAIATLPVMAGAFRHPDHLARGAALEVATGRGVRPIRQVRWDKPSDAGAPAWARFRALHGHGWRVIFDAGTHVPLRIYGQGIPAPAASADASAAEKVARAMLAEQIALLAPGARPADFVLVSNHADAKSGVRSIGFHQMSGGKRVLGAQVSFAFKNDRLFVLGSTAIPNVRPVGARTVGDRMAQTVAGVWLRQDQAEVTIGAVEGPFVLPLVDDQGVFAQRHVLRVKATARAPIGKWDVYVDAESGVPVAREQTLRFADATAQFDIPDRYPQNGRLSVPALFSRLTVNGTQVNTNLAGGFTYAGAGAANVGAAMVGPFVQVVNDAGAALAFAAVSLNAGGTVVFGRPDVEAEDAQVSGLVFANQVKEYVRHIAPDLAWLDASQSVTVNIADTCNAFSDGDSINFFQAGGGCGNTARLADVVHHETGHSVHGQSIIPGVGDFDGALSEGISDYLAATMANDCGMGKGFFNNNSPLRDCDEANGEATWQDDQGEIHTTGIIIAGAQWDLRTNLIATLGQGPGVALADRLWYACLQSASDIPSCYPATLAADDDDGNIDNGTPHKCAIDEAFGRHGLAAPGTNTGPGVRTPTLSGLHLTMPVVGSSSVACPGRDIASAKLEWKLREDAAQNGTVDLVETTEAYEGDLPVTGSGIVVNYKITVTFADNTTLSFPNNAADPFYELYLGETVDIYCTDFEADPIAAGWSHGLTMGMAGEGADDWLWGTPAGTSGSGDPNQAYSGTKVIGNDLGGGNFNGLYQSDKVNFMASPVIDTSAHTGVRLQYRRWLNVEDGDFDRSTIYADDQIAWQNFKTGTTMGTTQHLDGEWRFQDLDLTSYAADGSVQVKFEITSDGGLEFGGWTIDDFCIVGFAAAVPPGNPGDGDEEGGCGCRVGGTKGHDTGTTAGALATLLVAAGVLFVRRRARASRRP